MKNSTKILLIINFVFLILIGSLSLLLPQRTNAFSCISTKVNSCSPIPYPDCQTQYQCEYKKCDADVDHGGTGHCIIVRGRLGVIDYSSDCNTLYPCTCDTDEDCTHTCSQCSTTQPCTKETWTQFGIYSCNSDKPHIFGTTYTYDSTCTNLCKTGEVCSNIGGLNQCVSKKYTCSSTGGCIESATSSYTTLYPGFVNIK
jgi:hypothetical protein